MEARLADGRVLRFPDGTDPQVIRSTVKRVMAQPTIGPTVGARHSVTGLKQEQAPDPTVVERFAQARDQAKGQTFSALPPQPDINLFHAGMGKALTDTGRGIEQRARSLLGSESPELNADVAESRRRDAPLMDSPQGFAGNMAGHAGIGSLVPGAGTLLGTALAGTAIGAAAPTVEGESALINTLAGTGSAVAGHAGVGALGRVFNPQTPAQARQLIDEGVTLTPGQIVGEGGFAGRLAKSVEDKATSIPILGDAISRTRERGLEQFNRAALNRVVGPLDGEVTAIGHEGLEQAHALTRNAYDDVLPNITLRVDRVLQREVAGVDRLTANLSPQARDQFNNVLQNEVFSGFSVAQGGPQMAGAVFKRADTELGRLARSYRGSLLPADRDLGDAFALVQRVLRNGVTRTNPQHAPALRLADGAYRRLLRVERAGASSGAREGVFTASQLKQAVRALDPSLRKRSFAQGRAEMQDLSRAGEAVLPSSIPSSGTAERAILGGGLLGGAAVVEPMAALSALAATGVYTRPGAAMTQALMTRRPEIARDAGRTITDLIPYAAPSAAAASRDFSQ
jgi:hypothetical protein